MRWRGKDGWKINMEDERVKAKLSGWWVEEGGTQVVVLVKEALAVFLPLVVLTFYYLSFSSQSITVAFSSCVVHGRGNDVRYHVTSAVR